MRDFFNTNEYFLKDSIKFKKEYLNKSIISNKQLTEKDKPKIYHDFMVCYGWMSLKEFNAIPIPVLIRHCKVSSLFLLKLVLFCFKLFSLISQLCCFIRII